MKITITLSFVLILFFLSSCKKEIKGNPDRFKQGVFEIPAGEGYSKTIITRIDTLHIEEYSRKIAITNKQGIPTEKNVTRIDTLYIKWKNNFSYTLKMKSPKSEADKDLIYVQINKVTPNSYDFSARIGYSNFKQEGTVYKIK